MIEAATSPSRSVSPAASVSRGGECWAPSFSGARVKAHVTQLRAEYGVRVQRSVFECVVTSAGYERFCERLRDALGRGEGEIRMYRLCGACHRASRRVGRGVNPAATLSGLLVL